MRYIQRMFEADQREDLSLPFWVIIFTDVVFFVSCRPYEYANNFWKDHHQAVIIYPSKEIADAERAALEASRKESVQDNKNKMVEEYVGPIVMQLSEL